VQKLTDFSPFRYRSDNDVLSYKKDLKEGEELNLINILRAQGHTLQSAIDETGVMLQQRYRRWYRALADMPSWGARIDREVLRYLDGCRLVALGSLIWRSVLPLFPFARARLTSPPLLLRFFLLWQANPTTYGVHGPLLTSDVRHTASTQAVISKAQRARWCAGISVCGCPAIC